MDSYKESIGCYICKSKITDLKKVHCNSKCKCKLCITCLPNTSYCPQCQTPISLNNK